MNVHDDRTELFLCLSSPDNEWIMGESNRQKLSNNQKLVSFFFNYIDIFPFLYCPSFMHRLICQ